MWETFKIAVMQCEVLRTMFFSLAIYLHILVQFKSRPDSESDLFVNMLINVLFKINVNIKGTFLDGLELTVQI